MLKISNWDLWLADAGNPTIGLRLILQGKSSPVFIHLPWNKSLIILSNGRSMCTAMHSCAWTQPQSLSRGKHNYVFTEDNNKYYCVGLQPGRAKRGVQSGLYKLKYGFPSSDWDCVHKVLKRAEYAFDTFMETDEIQHIVGVRQYVNFRVMEWSPSSIHAKAARYYNGVSFGINVFLRCHVDFRCIWIQFHISVMIMGPRGAPTTCLNQHGALQSYSFGQVWAHSKQIFVLIPIWVLPVFAFWAQCHCAPIIYPT